MKYLLCLMMCLVAVHSFAREDTIDTQVCESAFDASGEWRYPDRNALEEALSAASGEKAARTIFAGELEVYTPTVFPEQKIVTALTRLVRCGEAELGVEAPLEFCMVLRDCRVDAAEQEKFRAVEIGRVCSINRDLVERQAETIRDAFARWMQNEEGISQSLASVAAMMDDPERIARYEAETLKALVHEIDAAPDANAVSGSTCRSLVVYPVELYTATLGEE